MKPRGLSAEWTLVAAWAAVAFCLVFAGGWLFEKIWVLSLGLQGIWALVGILLSLSLLFTGRWRQAGVLILFAVVVVVSPLASWGSEAWFWVSFKQNEGIYRDVVARTDSLPRQGEIRGVRYRIERGPPARVAFPQPVGVADNWGAVVHDPSDAVATAKGWGERPGEYTIRADLQELWGGDIVSCSRITGHYYRCWFT
jgi:hypothetical protein